MEQMCRAANLNKYSHTKIWGFPNRKINEYAQVD